MADGTRVASARSVELLACVAVELESSVIPAPQVRQVLRRVEAFLRFAEVGFGVTDLGVVSPAVAQAFVTAPLEDGSAPKPWQCHARRVAVRLLYRVAREQGLDVGDPTLDLVLPARPSGSARPLTDVEVDWCRGHALWSLTETRRRAVWALAEATATTREIACVTVADIELDRARVWLHGGSTTEPRWAYLDHWGLTQVAARLENTPELDGGLVYRGSGGENSGQVAVSLAITQIFTRAGLATDPGVRPMSITAWAGRRILAETGRIDEVARRLGIRSLDRAARLIDFEWSGEAIDR